MTDQQPDLSTKALTTIIDALRPLTSENRHRAVQAALIAVGETPASAPKAHVPPTMSGGEVAVAEAPSEAAAAWQRQNDVSADQLDHAFHFNGDGTFDIHNTPGSSKKAQTINTYILAGLGQYLATGSKNFSDKLARGFCESIGCYDGANHAAHLKKFKGAEFSGTKSKGYSITNVGLKRGAALVKELAGAS